MVDSTVCMRVWRREGGGLNVYVGEKELCVGWKRRVDERDFLGGEAGGKGRQQAGTKNYMYLEGGCLIGGCPLTKGWEGGDGDG